MRGGTWYHIYMPPAGQVIFPTDADCEQFLARYAKLDIETFAYCLLPDHFHFLVRIADWDSAEQKLCLLFTTITIPRPILRIPLRTSLAVTPLVCYIHANPVSHDPDLQNWQWSSHQAIATDTPTKIITSATLSRLHELGWSREQQWQREDVRQISHLILHDS